MGRPSKLLRFERLRKLTDGPYPALTITYGRRFLADYPTSARAWIWVGIALGQMARYEEAERALARCLELCRPVNRTMPLAQMGHLCRESGDYDRASAFYRKAIDAAPEDATYWIFLGAVKAKQGRFEEAERAHRSAIESPEGCIDEAYLNLGLVLRALERFEEAADCFREAIAIDPDYRAAHRALRDVERCLKLAGG